MAKNKIVIAGGTGFIGQHLKTRFEELGYNQVLIVSRSFPHIRWDDEGVLKEALNSSHLLINLAGKSVNCRHTQSNMATLLSSRLDTTRQLNNIVKQLSHPPKLWINASAAGIYHTANQEANDESAPLNDTPLSSIVQQWEQVFFDNDLPTTRRLALRLPLVLGRNGGVALPLSYLAKFGLGGAQGSGKQMVSWVHLEDIFQVILFAISSSKVEGAINCCSPKNVSNATFMKILRQVLKVPIGIPTPSFAVKFGALVMGTEPSLVFDSLCIKPQKLMEWGYNFRYTSLAAALTEIFA